jgi:predicted TIM-barrel fold metal-dependent hydrolase
MAMAQTVPLFGLWEEGFAPARLQYELKEACPERVVFCGGVDPLFHGIRGAVREMERQKEEWGAVSFKYYKAHGPRLSWKVDDRDIAYPMWEKAQKLGISHVQFHCGLPFGHERVEDLRPNDIQAAAADFPDLIFVIHPSRASVSRRDDQHRRPLRERVAVAVVDRVQHVGGVAMGHLRAARHGAAIGRQQESAVGLGGVHLARRAAAHRALRRHEDAGGIAGSLRLPEITEESKRNIFGLNQARLLGIDVERKMRELSPAMTDSERARSAGHAKAA